MSGGDFPLPPMRRRRIYLVRHGHVSYYDADGLPLNPKSAQLTAEGEAQARATGDVLAGVSLDRVVCSGLVRTRRTAELVCGDRGLTIEENSAFLEIRAGRLAGVPKERRLEDYVYGFTRAAEPDACFAGGDGFAAVRDRVVGGLEGLLADPSWNRLALIAHDGVNRMVLSWACGGGLDLLCAFEQDYGCLNVVDVDMEGATMVRTMIRAMNVSPLDPAKQGVTATSMEVAFGPLLRLD